MPWLSMMEHHVLMLVSFNTFSIMRSMSINNVQNRKTLFGYCFRNPPDGVQNPVGACRIMQYCRVSSALQFLQG